MRTTLALDDEVLTEARQYAASRELGLGQAITELLRAALSPPRGVRHENGFVVFDVPTSPRVTARHVRELESED